MRANQLLAAACVAVLAATTGQVEAALLTAAYDAQLETWLGQGPLNFTNIFTRAAGDGQDAYDFHAAVDGKGPTFALIQVVSIGRLNSDVMIGGYNPQSWRSSGGFNFTPNDPDRTAFLFNLTDSVIQTQKLSSNPSGWVGEYQTYNVSPYGPTFGGYHDLWVDRELASGYAHEYSYGPLVHSSNILGDAGTSTFTIGAMEVYSFSQGAVVPEPSSLIASLGMGGVGLIMAGVRRRRARRRTVAA